MESTAREFCQLAAEASLLAADECRRLAESFAQSQAESGPRDAAALADWLVEQQVISRYQARLLLAGRPGPFIYGDYVVYDRLSEGRLAGLFRARHASTHHPVTLWFLSGPAAEDPQNVARLRQEAAASADATRSERHLARCYHWVDLGAYKFIVLEHLEGQTVEDLLANRGRLPAADACRLVRQAALGLARLHDLGRVHAAVRPANLWIDSHGELKLLDFPLARDPLVGAAVALDAWRAPEFERPGRAADSASDVFSLGATLFQMLTGRPPQPVGEARKRLERQAASAAAGSSADVLSRLLLEMLEPDPGKRLREAPRVAAALEPLAGGGETQHQLPTTAAYEQWLTAHAAHQAGIRAAAVPLMAQAANAPAPPVAAPLVQAAGRDASQPPLAPLPVVVSGEASPLTAARVRRKSTAQRVWTGASLAAAAGVLGLAAWLLIEFEGRTGPPPGSGRVARAGNGGDSIEPRSSRNAGIVPSRRPAAEPPQRLETVRGIDQPIWQSPTDGPPLDLAWLAPGAQVVVAVRPAALLEHAEWEKLADPRTLGAAAHWFTTDLARLSGTTLENIETASIALLDGSPGPPRLALVIRCVDAVPRRDLLEAWGNPAAEKVGGHTIYTAAGQAWCIPAAGAGKLLVLAPEAEMRDVIAAEGRLPPLRRELEQLLAASDHERMLTILAAPDFFFTGGKSLFEGPAARLKEPFKTFLTLPDAEGRLELPKAILFSLNLADDLFLELRIHNSFAGRTEPAVARDYRRKLAGMPGQVNAYVRDLLLSPYSKHVLWDFPDRIRALERYTRDGMDDEQIVLRAYLPAVAAHNLALGIHLSLVENRGVAVPVAASPPGAGEQSVVERLSKKTSLTFPANTLETAIQLLADDIGVEIVILGADLQLEGITKNQSFALDERDLPAREILQKILLKANPGGKLIYTIKPQEGTGKQVIYVTTRAAAQKRGDPLPPGLE